METTTVAVELQLLDGSECFDSDVDDSGTNDVEIGVLVDGEDLLVERGDVVGCGDVLQ